jgi:hypothetical protein
LRSSHRPRRHDPRDRPHHVRNYSFSVRTVPDGARVDCGLNVFYAAPALKNLREFDNAYNNAFVAHIGPLPDDKSHTLAYMAGAAIGNFFSEPKSINLKTFDQLSEGLRATFEHKPDLRSVAQEIRENVVALASPRMRQAEQQIAERIRSSRCSGTERPASFLPEESALVDILVAREIARVDMGVELLVAQPR